MSLGHLICRSTDYTRHHYCLQCRSSAGSSEIAFLCMWHKKYCQTSTETCQLTKTSKLFTENQCT